MIEFLIRRTDDEWFDFPPNSGCEVYQPRGFSSRQIEGWGECRLDIEGCEVSFSYEMPGIQVSFQKGTIENEKAVRIAEAILATIEEVTGQQGEVVQISWAA